MLVRVFSVLLCLVVCSTTQAQAKPSKPRLLKILKRAPGHPPAFAKVVDLNSGEVVFSHNANKRLTPASVSKMFTTAAAALKIPLSRKLHTDVFVSKRKGAKRLVLRGGGDMSLTRQHLQKLAAAVKQAKIKRVKTLWIDSTLFDRKLPRGFNEKLTDSSYRAPIDALNVDKGTVGIQVRPGAKPGVPALVSVFPPSAAIVIDSTAKTVKGKRSGLVVKTRAAKGGKTTVIVRGKIGVKRKRATAVRKRVESAALHAGYAFTRMLRDLKIKVAKVRFGAPRGGYKGYKRLARHSSPTLRELMTFCNQFSHNGYAESFFKLVGAEVRGAPGTCAKGERAVREALKGSKIAWKTVKLGNGSGLYHANHFTADAVVSLLTYMADQGDKGDAWRRTLAIGGVKGTLRRRLRASVVGAKVYGKTGTLDDVTALAGYALGKKKRYAFALFFNGVKRPAYLYRRVHDRFLEALVSPNKPQVKKTKTRAKVSARKRRGKRRAKTKGTAKRRKSSRKRK